MPKSAEMLLSKVIVVEFTAVTVTSETGELGSVDVTLAPTYISGFSSDKIITLVFSADCPSVDVVPSTTS